MVLMIEFIITLYVRLFVKTVLFHYLFSPLTELYGFVAECSEDDREAICGRNNISSIKNKDVTSNKDTTSSPDGAPI